MRKPLLIALSLLALTFLGLDLQAGSGGPDTWGYIWKDSNEPDVNYNFLDIRNDPGAVLVTGLGDDNAVGPFNMGFDFPYYWSMYNSVKIGSNGWLSFDNIGNISSCFPSLPFQNGANNIVAPYMSDLIPAQNLQTDSAEVHYWTNSTDSFIVQYTNVGWWQNPAPGFVGNNTFQVIFDASDSTITFNYQETDAANFPTSGGCTGGNMVNMAVGIENLTGNFGLGVFGGNAVPGDSFTIKFFAPAVGGVQIPDATPAWNSNAENGGVFYFINNAVDLMANVENVGTRSITQSINVTATIDSTATGGTVYTNSILLDSLSFGADTNVMFGTQLFLPEARSYFYNVSLSSNDDVNPTNNENTTEVVGVEQNGSTGAYGLTYWSGSLDLQTFGLLSWSGGSVSEGVAVEFFPPNYPYELTDVSIWFFQDNDITTPFTHGCNIVIYDGPGGTEIHRDSLTPADLVDNGWTDYTLSSNVTINSGSFVVAWEQGGSDLAIVNESNGPISRRSYEILGGSWAPYRDNDNNEFLIRTSGSAPVAIENGREVTNSMVAFPNPAHNVLNVKYDVEALSDVKFRMLDLSGKTVWAKHPGVLSAGAYTLTMDLNDLTTGVYFFEMNVDGKRVVEKVIVE